MSLSLHYHYRIWWVLSVLAVLLRLVDAYNTLVLSTYLDVRAKSAPPIWEFLQTGGPNTDWEIAPPSYDLKS